MARRRIALCISNFNPGGAETQFWNLVKGLNRNRFEVHVVLLAYRTDPPAAITGLGETRIVTIRRKHRYDIASILSFARHLSRNRIELVQSMLFMDNRYARLAGRLSGVKVISSIRGEIGPLLGKSKTWVEFRMQHLSTCITTNSDWLRNYLITRGSQEDKLITIHNGIDIVKFKSDEDRGKIKQEFGIPAQSMVVGIVARLHPMKGHEVFLRAFHVLHQHIPDLIGIVVGDGERREELEKLAEDLGLSDAIIFLGSVTDGLQQVYRIMDLLMLTSRYGESFPNVLLEAMSAGVPVIGSNISAVPEIIDDGVNGFLVENGDVTDFSQTARKILIDETLHSKLAANGRKRADQFTAQRMVKKYEALYEQVLGI